MGGVNKTIRLVIKELKEKTNLELIKLRKRILLADSNEFKSYISKAGVYAFDCLPMPHYVWLVEFYEGNALLGIVLLDASAHKGNFIDHMIAEWFGEDIVLFRSGREDCRCRVKTYPSVYSNLLEVLKYNK